MRRLKASAIRVRLAVAGLSTAAAAWYAWTWFHSPVGRWETRAGSFLPAPYGRASPGTRTLVVRPNGTYDDVRVKWLSMPDGNTQAAPPDTRPGVWWIHAQDYEFLVIFHCTDPRRSETLVLRFDPPKSQMAPSPWELGYGGSKEVREPVFRRITRDTRFKPL